MLESPIIRPKTNSLAITILQRKLFLNISRQLKRLRHCQDADLEALIYRKKIIIFNILSFALRLTHKIIIILNKPPREFHLESLIIGFGLTKA